MLLRLVGLLKLIFFLANPVSILGRELKGDFEEKKLTWDCVQTFTD